MSAAVVVDPVDAGSAFFETDVQQFVDEVFVFVDGESPVSEEGVEGDGEPSDAGLAERVFVDGDPFGGEPLRGMLRLVGVVNDGSVVVGA